MALTPYGFRHSSAWYEAIEKRFRRWVDPLNRGRWARKLSALKRLPPQQSLRGHLIVLGCGVFGKQLLNAFRRDRTIVAIDNDPFVVSGLLESGNFSVFGNAENDELWESVQLNRAKLVVLSIASPKESAAICYKIKQRNPKLAVFSRAHTLEEAKALYDSGCDFVVLPDVLAGNQCIEIAAHYLEKGKLPKGFEVEEFEEYLKERKPES